MAAPEVDTDICVVGAGSGGLSVAAGAARMGARVVLIEKDRMGGECLNTGCVPSKSLLAAAHAAQAARTATVFGVRSGDVTVDFPAVHRHVQGVIAAVAPHDSQERFEALGVRVLRAPARFLDRRTVVADGLRVRARRFVLATGSSPAVPPVEGLDAVPYLTNETVFALAERPEHLVVIGGGPIGCELAQAFRRLGAAVTLLAHPGLLDKEDPDLTAVVRARLAADGVDVRDGIAATRVQRHGNGVGVALDDGTDVAGSHLLLAAGRRPNVHGLDLEKAGVAYDDRGIRVDARLRTSNRRVFAVGDVAGGAQFTHLAAHHAAIVLRNVLFRLPARVDRAAVPRVTYTDPEIAQVGLTEAEARTSHGDGLRVLRWSFADNDRAVAERQAEGLVKVIVDRRGRVLGAGMVGPRAGDLLLPWILAVERKVSLRDLAGLIVPYPTFGEVTKRVAGGYYTDRLFSDRTRAVVRFLMRLP